MSRKNQFVLLVLVFLVPVQVLASVGRVLYTFGIVTVEETLHSGDAVHRECFFRGFQATHTEGILECFSAWS